MPKTTTSQAETSGLTADLRAKVFRDREHSGDWRVEKMDEDGAIELALFSGGDARVQPGAWPSLYVGLAGDSCHSICRDQAAEVDPLKTLSWKQPRSESVIDGPVLRSGAAVA